MPIDKAMLNMSELRLKWAVEDVNKAVEKLLTLLDEQRDVEAIELLNNYLDRASDYYELAKSIREELE